MTKHQLALEAYKNTQELIRFMDQKAGAILVVLGLVFTGFIQIIQRLSFTIEDLNLYSVLAFLLGLVTIGSLLMSLFIVILNILRPRLPNTSGADNLSIFYFQNVAKQHKEELYSNYLGLEEKDLLSEITNQLSEVSLILVKKSRFVSRALYYLLISIVSLMLLIICVNVL